MFDIGWGELLVIGMVALIVIGPKELPGTLRALGQMMGKVRRMAGEFQNQFHEAIREAELSDLKKEVDDMASQAKSYTNFDPLDDVRREIETAVGPLPPLDTPPTDEAKASVTSSGSETPEAHSEASPGTIGTAEPVPAAELPAPATQASAEPAPMAPSAEPATVTAGADAPKPDAGKAP
jgi:sec-independent protein translocase protein TatB